MARPLNSAMKDTVSSFQSLSINYDDIPDEFIAAVHYYRNILKKISPIKEFPIKRLIGYRGQASHDIQIMAKNDIELWQFLIRFPRIFIVTGNMDVMLNNATSKKSIVRGYSNVETNLRVNAAVEYYAKILESKGRMSIKQLVGHRGQAPQDVQLYAKNDAELNSLLTSYPRIFTVTPDMIVFLSNSKNNCDINSENIISSQISDYSPAVTYYQQILNRISPNSKYSILRLVGYRGQAPLDVKNVAKNEFELTSFLRQYSNIFTVDVDGMVSLSKNEKVISSTSNRVDTKFLPHISNSDFKIAVDYYRAILEKFGPNFECSLDWLSVYGYDAPHAVTKIVVSTELQTFLCKFPNIFTVERDKVFLSDRGYRKARAVHFYRNILLSTKDKRLSLHSLLEHRSQASPAVKIVAKNELQLTALLLCYPSIFQLHNEFVYLTDYIDKRCLYKNEGIFPSISHSFKNPHYNNWEDYVLNNTTLVEDLTDCINICKTIMKETVIAVDCEGYNLGRGKISIIQIGLVNRKIFIFDILEDPNMILHGGLKQIMESEEIVKVMHYCRNDSMNLILQFGVGLKNVFDTSVAYNVVENGLLTMSNFKPIGINQICIKYGAPENSCKDEVKDLYKRVPGYWLARPLTQEMIAYAALDVASLVPYLYNELQKRLDDKSDFVVWKLSQKLCKQ